MKKFLATAGVVLAIVSVALIVRSCGIYSFTGTSIQPDVYTITINNFEYKALRVNPTLSNDLTEALRDKFSKLTRLEQVDEEGDLEIEGEITGYDTKSIAVTSDEVASQNRLTVTVKIYFTNRKYPEDDLEKNFSQYADYSSDYTLDSMEDELCEEIIDNLVEDIFNATVAQW